MVHWLYAFGGKRERCFLRSFVRVHERLFLRDGDPRGEDGSLRLGRSLGTAEKPEAPVKNVLESGGLYPFTELLSDAKACSCDAGTLSPETRGETSMYGRLYRRIVCSCGRKGPWSTAPVTTWNHQPRTG